MNRVTAAVHEVECGEVVVQSTHTSIMQTAQWCCLRRDGNSLRGLPLAQRTAQGQSGVTLFIRELVRFEELPHCRWRE